MERRCQALDRATGENCQREATARAARREEDGSTVDLLLCDEHYESFRLAGMVGPRRAL
jgi:hypothetical protein